MDSRAGAQPPTGGANRWGTVAAATLLVAGSYAFRVPPLLNARSTNSDAAIVGLQAMHILRGEYSAFLWGSGYQTSADAFVAALFFRVGGPTPLALMLSALTLHVIATVLVFATLRRRFSPWTALVLTMPLVVSSSAIHTYALYPPRQLSLTLAVASLWALHGAARGGSPRAQRWLAAGGALLGFSISADPYPLVLAPIILGFGLVAALGRRGPERVALLGAGVLVGFLPFLLLRQSRGAAGGPLGLSFGVLGHNWDLLVQECLPWALSYKVYFAHNVMDYVPWDPPTAVKVIQLTGALAVFAIVAFAFVAVTRPDIPRSTRHLGLAGAMTYPLTIGAFLVSVMVMDHFSMRYLAVLTIMLPFAAAPAAQALGGPRFAAVITPHLVASALCGWVGYGPFVRGITPVRETPELGDDYALFELLRARGITYGQADYWASYRLTLLFREQIVIVPTNAAEDRYPPYRRAFEAAPAFAYVFDPGRSRESLADAEQALVDANGSVEKLAAGRHTVFIVTR